MRLQLAVLSGKLTRFFSRLMRLGEGSTLPGKLARIIHPQILQELAGNRNTLLVTGTNGKTTTSHLLARALETSAYSLVHNSYGANLETGIITSLLTQASIWGEIHCDYNLFEIDEATLPLIIQDLHPHVIILTNLFRDQLDRYGDLEGLIKKMGAALSILPETTTLVVNGDDPLLFSLTQETSLSTLYFGLNKEEEPGYSVTTADIHHCPRCGSRYLYQARYYAHLGLYYCSSCGNQRPKLQVYAEDILLLDGRSQFTLHYPKDVLTVQLPLPGIFNIYNLLAAFSAALLLGFSPEIFNQSLGHLKPVFGRMEECIIFNRPVRIILVKNPTGFNEVLRIVAGDKRKKGILFFLNDKTADGEDVSWIWDVDFSGLTGDESCFVSGLRKEEMALRLKYSDIQSRLFSYRRESFQEVLETAPGEILYILPTYTALLRVRRMIAQLVKKEGSHVS